MIRDRNRFFEAMLSDRYKGHWLYAHNGSGYDFRYLVAWLLKRGVPFTGFSAGSRLFLEVEGRHFLDSMAVLPMSLREAAEKLGAHYKKHEVPPDFYKNIKKYDWHTYLEGDLRALYECIAILRHAVSELGGRLKRTLASTAVDLWQRCYLTGRYDVPSHDDDVEHYAREAYAGGRCEVIKRHIGEGEYWDINSSYPHAMLTPVPVVSLGARPDTVLPDSGLVYARYDIPTDETIPPLFWRKERGSRLYHPTGTWEGWRTVDEARYVRSLYGTDAVKISSIAPFQAVDLFSSYVHDLYAKRLVPGPVGVVAKRLLNSLYGRTGMSRERERIVHGELPPRPVKLLSRDHGLWLEPTKSMEHNATIMPAVAATITARGRISVDRLLRKAPDPAYCDTDSVVTGGHMPLEQTKDLGGAKREAEVVSATFVAPKAYRIVERTATTVHAKGMPRKEAQLLADYLDGKPVRVGRIPGIRESLRRGLPVDGAAEWQERRHAAGGNRHPDGRPYRVEELTVSAV